MDRARLFLAWERFRASRALAPVGSSEPLDAAMFTDRARAALRRWFPDEHVDGPFAVPPDALIWFTEIAHHGFGDADRWLHLAASRDVPWLTIDRWEVLSDGGLEVQTGSGRYVDRAPGGSAR